MEENPYKAPVENPYRAPESVDQTPPPVRWGLRLWLALICYLAAAVCLLLFFDWLEQGDVYYAVLSIIAVAGFACFGSGLPLNRTHLINTAFLLILIVLVGWLGRAGVSYLMAR